MRMARNKSYQQRPIVPLWVYKFKVRKMNNVGYLGCVQIWESGIPSCGFLEFEMRGERGTFESTFIPLGNGGI